MASKAVSLLRLSNIHVSVEGKDVVRGVDLEIHEGEIHAIMGPNGSGKSSLVSALMGHPAYTVTGGSAQFRGKDLFAMEPHERALAGLFLAFQYPKEIGGVSLQSFLLAAHRAQASSDSAAVRLSPMQFGEKLQDAMKALQMDPSFAVRPMNKGFSGGEKKKAEILQMLMLRPRLALLDETDSGLDVDALRTVAEGINVLRTAHDVAGKTNKPINELTNKRRAPFSALVVTHYARILEYVQPDRVHVMIRGQIVESGDADLAYRLEKEGYATYGVTEEGKIRLEEG